MGKRHFLKIPNTEGFPILGEQHSGWCCQCSFHGTHRDLFCIMVLKSTGPRAKGMVLNHTCMKAFLWELSNKILFYCFWRFGLSQASVLGDAQQPFLETLTCTCLTGAGERSGFLGLCSEVFWGLYWARFAFGAGHVRAGPKPSRFGRPIPPFRKEGRGGQSCLLEALLDLLWPQALCHRAAMRPFRKETVCQLGLGLCLAPLLLPHASARGHALSSSSSHY